MNLAKNSFYVTDPKGNVKKLAATMDSGARFNSSMTQVLFSSDNILYISVKGGEPQELEGFESDYLGYLYAPQFGNWATNAGRALRGKVESVTLRFKSLNTRYYMGVSHLGYLDQNWIAREISANAESSWLSKDEGTLFYCENGLLYMLEHGKLTEPILIPTKEGVYAYAVTNDGKALYYTDSDGTLWYQKVNGEPKHVAEDVAFVRITHDNYAIFCVDADAHGVGTVYGCKNGKNKKLLFENCRYRDIQQHVTLLNVQNKNEEGKYDIYAAQSGLNFSKVAEAVSW